MQALTNFTNVESGCNSSKQPVRQVPKDLMNSYQSLVKQRHKSYTLINKSLSTAIRKSKENRISEAMI